MKNKLNEKRKKKHIPFLTTLWTKVLINCKNTHDALG